MRTFSIGTLFSSSTCTYMLPNYLQTSPIKFSNASIQQSISASCIRLQVMTTIQPFSISQPNNFLQQNSHFLADIGLLCLLNVRAQKVKFDPINSYLSEQLSGQFCLINTLRRQLILRARPIFLRGNSQCVKIRNSRKTKDQNAKEEKGTEPWRRRLSLSHQECSCRASVPSTCSSQTTSSPPFPTPPTPLPLSFIYDSEKPVVHQSKNLNFI